MKGLSVQTKTSEEISSFSFDMVENKLNLQTETVPSKGVIPTS